MQISVTGHHVEVTEALRNYVDTKFDKLERHFDQVIDVHVILSVESCGKRQRRRFKSTEPRSMPTRCMMICMQPLTG